MTSLRIDQIKLKNIRCFDSVKIDFGPGANVITGPNGSGKSTILTAIGYGLYGSDYLHGTSMKISDLVKRGELKGRIELSFSTDKGQFSSLQYISTKTGNSWKIYQKGISDPLAETINESKEFVLNLLGSQIDTNVFKNAIASAQGDITRLLDITASNRKNQIRKILGLQNFDITGDHLGKFSRKLKENKEVTEKNRAILLGATEDDKQIKESLENLKSEASELETTIKSKQKKFDEIDLQVKQLTISKNEIELKEQQIIEGEKRLNNLFQEITEFKNRIQDIRKKINDLPVDILEVQKFVENKEKELEKAKDLQKEIKTQLDTHSELSENLKQRKKALVNDTETKTNLTKRIELIKKDHDVASFDTKIEELASKIANRKDRVDVLESQIEIAKTSIIKTEGEQKDLSTKTKLLRKNFEEEFQVTIDRIDDLKDQNIKNSEIIENKIKLLDEKLLELTSESSVCKEKIEITKQTLELIKHADTDTECPICMRTFEDAKGEVLLNHHSKELDSFKNEYTDIQNRLSETEVNRETMFRKKTECDNKDKKLLSYLAQSDHLVEWEDRLLVIKEELDSLKDQEINLKKDLNSLHIDEFEKMNKEKEELDEIRDQFRSLSNEALSISSAISSQETEISIIENKLKDFDIEDITNHFKKVEGEINHLSALVKIIREDVLSILSKQDDRSSESKKLQTQISEQQGELKKLQTAFDPIFLKENESLYDTLNREIGINKGKLTLLTDERIPEFEGRLEKAIKNKELISDLTNQLEEYTSILPAVEKVRGIIERVPTSIINKISTNLSARLTQTVQRLLPGRGYDKVVFYPSGDITLYNNGNQVNNSTLSGGEKTVLGLAVRLALADYVAPLQFLILDEPTNHLDRERVQEFVEIVDRENIFQTSTGQLLLVTHRQEFDRNAQQSIRLGIVNGRRKIVS